MSEAAHLPPLARVEPAAPIAYVLKVFPRVSETFIINEIRLLEQLGEALRIFSLHHPPAAVPHGVLRELRSPVRYVEDELPDDTMVGKARRQLSDELGVRGDVGARVLPRKYVRLALALATHVRASGARHLHAHFASRAGHVAALAARLTGVPFSLTAHAKDIYHREVDRDLLRWKVAEARFVVTVSDYNCRHLRELVADLPQLGHKIVRIYNGVDLERFRPAPVVPGTPLLLGVGRLVEKKGFAVLVAACRLLRQRGIAFRCEIIGGGPEEAELRARIEAAHLGDVITLRGVLSTEDVAEALREAAIVALPCIVGSDGNVDALPTILLEAMATARPVISTRLSGIPEIVADGETGVLVAPGNPEALADAVAGVLADAGRAAAMGLAGRRRAEQLFDLRRNAAGLHRLLSGGMRGAAEE